MKKQLFKKMLWMLLALLLCASSLTGCKKGQGKEEETAKKSKVVQLLGFESYEEFTGAKIKIGNMLGDMNINTDKKYISQGKGSLQVQPQGDYSEQRKYPYFALDFLNTTCATCDFTEFESIAFDVYNATDKELHVRASFSVGKDDGNYTTTIKTTYTLKPNGWTTCTYDISEMGGYSYYDFMNVRYMTIEFMEHKVNKEDVPNVLYIDNLVGNCYGKDTEEIDVSYDFWEGVTFENSADQYLVFGEDYVTNRTELSRATYEKEGIHTVPEVGKYGMKADATESIWPKFTVRLGEEVPENTVFTFMAYIQVDAAKEDSFGFESSSPFGGNNIQHLVSISDTVFNEWFEVTIRTQKATDMISGFFNFDNFTDPITGHSRFGNKPVVIYLDNMKLSEYVDPLSLAPENPDFTKGITFEDEAEKYLVANNAVVAHQAMKLSRIAWAEEDMKVGSEYGRYGMKGVVKGAAYPEMTISYKKEVPKGTLLTFMAYIKADASKASAVKTESIGNVDLSGSLSLNKWVEIQIELSEAAESTRMFFNFDDGTGNTVFGNEQVLIYFDNIRLELPAKPEGDFLKGVDFETPGNAGLFVGAKEPGIEWKDATISRVKYSSAGIEAPENGGAYALKLSHIHFGCPSFRINFGTKLPKGTTLTFMAYGTVHEIKAAPMNRFEYAGNDPIGPGKASDDFKLNEWTEITITLREATDYICLFWNYEIANPGVEQPGALYVDNFKAELPADPEGDFLKGVDFEIAGNAALFTGAKETGLEWKDATIARVKYSKLSIPALANGGSYALKLSHAHFGCPSFRINFGTTLPKGTTLSFMAYGTVDEIKAAPLNRFEYCKNDPAGEGNAFSDFKLNEWTEVTITLREATDYICLFWNYEIANPGVEQPGALYIDNVKADLPADPEGDFVSGIDFEKAGNAALFTGAKETGLEWKDATIARVKYDKLTIPTLTNGGSYALQLSHAHFGCPSFKMDFGRELPAGTTLSFMAYGTVDKITAEPLSRFEYCTTETAGTGRASADFELNKWTEVKITLTKAASTLSVFWNYEIANPGVEQPGALYVDNFKATLPIEPEGSFLDGVGFEVEGNVSLMSSSTFDLTRVEYANESVTAESGFGTYAMKGDVTGMVYPTFALHYGETIPAGTTLDFWVYVKTDATVPAGTTIRLERSKSQGWPEAFTNVGLNQWVKITFTLDEATDTSEIFFNLDAGGEVSIFGREKAIVYFDNFKATIPAPTFNGDVLEGVGFEMAGDAEIVSSNYAEEAKNMPLSRVDYASEGMTVEDTYGTYGIKGSIQGSVYPQFAFDYKRELPAGTTIDFSVYVKSATNTNASIRLERVKSQGWPEASANFGVNQWVDVRFTLDEATNVSEIFFNLDDGTGNSILGQEEVTVYIDNLKAELPAEGNFFEGVGFEAAGNHKLFTGWKVEGVEWADATIERIAYADAGITAPTDGGTYALKLSHTFYRGPRFIINLGQEVPAGSKLTFMAYAVVDAADGENTQFFVVADKNNPAQSIAYTNAFPLGTWTPLTITIPQATDHLTVYWDYSWAYSAGDWPGVVYVDNFKVTLPPADFETGVAFENEADASLLSSSYGEAHKNMALSRVKYADENMTVEGTYGTHAMKGDITGKTYPQFAIHYNEELPADTVLKFWIYIKTDASVSANTTIRLERIKSQGWPEAFTNVGINQWVEITFTLDTATSVTEIFFNLDNGAGSSVFGSSNAVVYIDNIKVALPKSNAFLAGVDFEAVEHANLFAGWEVAGVEWADANIERVDYASAGISAPTNGGTSALKIGQTDFAWPRFELNFGESLPAGTKLTFMAYGLVDGAAQDARTRFEANGNSQGKATVTSTQDSQESGLFTVGGWTEITVTLSEATETLQMFWNMDVAGGSSGAVYVDNFKAILP